VTRSCWFRAHRGGGVTFGRLTRWLTAMSMT